MTLRGSSPLARGTQPHACNIKHADRFIPAGAGNTGLFADTGLGKTVHPRWRGEHV